MKIDVRLAFIRQVRHVVESYDDIEHAVYLKPAERRVDILTCKSSRACGLEAEFTCLLKILISALLKRNFFRICTVNECLPLCHDLFRRVWQVIAVARVNRSVLDTDGFDVVRVVGRYLESARIKKDGIRLIPYSHGIKQSTVNIKY